MSDSYGDGLFRGFCSGMVAMSVITAGVRSFSLEIPLYGNEGVGSLISKSGVPAEDIRTRITKAMPEIVAKRRRELAPLCVGFPDQAKASGIDCKQVLDSSSALKAPSVPAKLTKAPLQQTSVLVR